MNKSSQLYAQNPSAALKKIKSKDTKRVLCKHRGVEYIFHKTTKKKK